MLDQAAPRSFVWWVVLGLALGAVLVVHSLRQIFRAFPDDTRAAAAGAVRSRPRLVAASAVVGAWTLLYLLYSLAYPSAAIGPNQLGASRSPGAQQHVSVLNPAFPQSDTDTSPEALDSAGGLPVETARSGAPEESTPAPGGGGGTPPAPCSVDAQAQAVRDAQTSAEALTGRPLGADGGALVEALAGCKDPTAVALSLLGPVNQLLNDAGIPMLPIPALPGLPPFFLPEAIAGPLRGPVFEQCGTLLRQIYTAAAVAPVARIPYESAIAVGDYVAAVCGAFAPAPSS